VMAVLGKDSEKIRAILSVYSVLLIHHHFCSTTISFARLKEHEEAKSH